MNGLQLDSVPARRELVWVWGCYGLFALGWFMLWPALLGLVIAYAKRGEPDLCFIDSHYRGLITLFWWWLAWSVVCVGLITVGAGPLLLQLIEALRVAEGNWNHVGELIQTHWRTVFLGAAVAALGLVSALILWLWVAYRWVRGLLRLADARSVD